MVRIGLSILTLPLQCLTSGGGTSDSVSDQISCGNNVGVTWLKRVLSNSGLNRRCSAHLNPFEKASRAPIFKVQNERYTHSTRENVCRLQDLMMCEVVEQV
jgi:hypothetical protein